jgi:hypothetical protein
MTGHLLAADRLSDRSLKRLFEQLDSDCDRFEDALDDSLKRSVIRGPAGEVDVSRCRINDDKPASAEAQQLVDIVDRVGGLASSRTPSGQGQTAWQTISAGVEKIAQEFGLRSSAALAR